MKIRIVFILFVTACLLFLTAFYAFSQAEASTGKSILLKIYFESGSNVISKKSVESLKEILAELQKNASMALEIKGYSDNLGPEKDNMKLSHTRAQAVHKWFAGRSIDSNRLKTSGHGTERPVANNSTAKGRELNRRVEIVKVINKVPVVFFPENSFEFKPVVEGSEVRHNFIIRNKGNAILAISKVKPG